MTMTDCACPKCNLAPTYSEAWMLACEARYVLQIKGLDDRREYLIGVEQARGPLAAARLRTEILSQWHE